MTVNLGNKIGYDWKGGRGRKQENMGETRIGWWKARRFSSERLTVRFVHICLIQLLNPVSIWAKKINTNMRCSCFCPHSGNYCFRSTEGKPQFPPFICSALWKEEGHLWSVNLGELGYWTWANPNKEYCSLCNGQMRVITHCKKMIH